MTLSELYTRKREINAALDGLEHAHAFSHLDDETLLDELTKVCDQIDAIKDREIYANISPCNF